MPFEDLVAQVAGTLDRDGQVQPVFGPAIQMQHHAIVPVAIVTSGGGAGGAQNELEASFAGGVGVGFSARPVGFIYERGEEVIFTPIHLDGRNKPLWTEAAIGVRKAVDLTASLIAQLVRRPASPSPPAPPK